jgi:hypothetical protein
MQNLPHLSRQWFGSKMRAPVGQVARLASLSQQNDFGEI